MYRKIFRPILFLFDPEMVHVFSTLFFKFIFKIPGLKFIIKKSYCIENPLLERKLWGLTFKNPVGLAAGFDKDAKLFNQLSYFGFGFIEIGTITPKAQSGNPKKRLFRLTKDFGIINRMGFNNEGVKSIVERLKRKKNILIGGNIGKNKNTLIQNAYRDYKECFLELFPYVDYFVVNVSSPNTPNLRELQKKIYLKKLLSRLSDLNKKNINPRPILLKISPDLTDMELLEIINIVETVGLDGIVATNTSINRSNLRSNQDLINQKGGLSGKPLSSRSNYVIKFISKNSKNKIPIIGVGGIHSPEDAIEKINSGATLIQLYTGFVYEGPGIIRSINKKLIKEKVNYNN
ncbi:MAG: quinone-dependent dihydroorotate dehydrogenase [Flavobacteriaceae bacterium]|nr:quinone-dependent dihydroorotate dehydrogenase [Flavobacteriaceae bacterium]